MMKAIAIIMITNSILSVGAFSTKSVKIHSLSNIKAKHSTLKMISPEVIWEGSRYLAALPVMYSLMSVNEYITHRYYQHAEFNRTPWMQKIASAIFGQEKCKTSGGGHVEHHAETYDDMSLRDDDRWKRSPASIMLDEDPYRGTAFSWKVLGLMTVQMLPTTLPVFAILGFSLFQTFSFLLPCMLLHGLVWNALHPAMHTLPANGIAYGPPSEWLAGLRNSWFFKYLYQNHEGHHVLGGQCNYNVCCPGTDHLVGTYVKESQWRPKAKVPVVRPIANVVVAANTAVVANSVLVTATA